jgi:hypothetical protein
VLGVVKGLARLDPAGFGLGRPWPEPTLLPIRAELQASSGNNAEAADANSQPALSVVGTPANSGVPTLGERPAASRVDFVVGSDDGLAWIMDRELSSAVS